MSNQIFIAEVKTQSPGGFRSPHSWDDLFELALEHGDWVAVHTDERWGGSFELLERARRIIRERRLWEKGLVAKGIHATHEEQRRAFQSADMVLVVPDSIPYSPARIMLEVPSIESLRWIDRSFRCVWNQRDLTDALAGYHGQDSWEPDARKLETFEQAREAFPGWLCQASFIRTPEDVHPEANAFVVGTHLPEFIEARGEA